MRKSFLPLLLLLLTACGQPSSVVESPDWPDIFPDYCGVTIPDDLAGLTFAPIGAEHFRIEKTREADTLWYTVTTWSRGKKSGTRYRPFPVYLSHDAIDPCIAYRLIEPGYESWYDMGIYQRQLSSYKETAIVTNRANNRGCINCHTFQSGNPDDMLFHARGAGGGTVFVKDGHARLVNLREAGPHKQGVYPARHPNGRYVVFSSNDTHQCFSMAGHQPIEVYDLSSDIILMDLATDSVVAPAMFNTPEVWETFPSWSPDGRTLFYCAADSVEGMPHSRGRVHYRLMARAFDPSTALFADTAQCLFASPTSPSPSLASPPTATGSSSRPQPSARSPSGIRKQTSGCSTSTQERPNLVPSSILPTPRATTAGRQTASGSSSPADASMDAIPVSSSPTTTAKDTSQNRSCCRRRIPFTTTYD